MTKIINGTSHQINIYNLEETYAIQGGRKLILKEDCYRKATYVIEAGTNLNAQTATKAAPELDVPFNITGGVYFTGHDPIPEADIVVVSNMFRSAVIELGGSTANLATVSGTVYESEESLRPCGCTGLAVG